MPPGGQQQASSAPCDHPPTATLDPRTFGQIDRLKSTTITIVSLVCTLMRLTCLADYSGETSHVENIITLAEESIYNISACPVIPTGIAGTFINIYNRL